LNVSTLARTPPIKLTDGSLALPVYHELIHKHGEWLRLSPQGDVMTKTRMPHPRNTLQPSVIPIDSRKAIALLRDAGAGKGHIQISTTEDGGRHWLPGSALPLTNPNSSIAALRLHDGRYLMAANPGEGRHILELWTALPNPEQTLSLRWEKVAVIDSPTHSPVGPPVLETDTASAVAPANSNGSGPIVTDECSYPALLQTKDGLIHLAYTWHRQRIRVISFNLAWLDAAKPAIQAKNQRQEVRRKP
jgi:predicted neuraminidase